MDIFPLPELHLMLGCVNGLLTEMNKRWQEEINIENPVWKFCDREGIKKITYRGLALEGPQCKALDTLSGEVPQSIKPFVNAIKAFNSLRNLSFSDDLLPSFEEDLNRFYFYFDLLD